MPNRTTDDERNRFDHSAHPTSRATKDDLNAPGAADLQRPPQTGSEIEPPPDDEERIKDFFSRHGGPANTPRRFGAQEGGLQGWSEIQAGDGHVLRCDWSRMGSRKEINYSEVAPAPT